MINLSCIPLFQNASGPARWITAEAPNLHEPDWPDLHWIAAKGEGWGEAFFRLSFSIPDPSALSLATLRIAGKRRSDVYLNGQLLKRCIHWLGTYEVDLVPHLKPGKNVLALQAIDRDTGEPVLAPLLCLRDASGDHFLTPEAGWRARPLSAPAEWTQVWFDDRTWPAAHPAPAGKPGKQPDKGPRSLLFQKTFTLDTPPASATVCVTALGLYDLRINGETVGHEHLTPGWTEYDKRIEFQTFDVTPLLRPGDNRIEITLGNGWWILHHKGFQEDGIDCRLKARLLLSLKETDGAVRHIGTDASWTARPSAWLMNHLYYGETVDFVFDAAAEFPVEVLPEQAPLVPHAAEPIVVTERLAPLSITRTPSGTHLIDFGQNLAGWVELQPPPVPVKRLTLRHAETLRPDGSLNTDSLRSANATETYLNIPAGGEALYPRFTYHGFRYCEVHGWPGDLAPEQLRACFVHTALNPAGRFTCSDPTLNRIWEATRQTLRGNFHAVPSDCPQRDERLGWMADAGNIPDVAALFFDISTYFDKWAVDMADAMDKSGYFPNFAPGMGGSERGAARGTPGWADAGVIVPWTLFEIYGDTKRLAVHYPHMRRHLETLIAESKDGLFEVKGWGDWLAVEESPQEPIGTAYFFHCTRLLAQSARILGYSADAERYEALLPIIRDAYQRAYFDPATSRYLSATQTLQAMPLYFGITPAELVPGVLRVLLDDLNAHENHLTTGFLGTPFLIKALTRAGEHDLLFDILTQRDFPSHGRILDAGATTITEAWNAYLGDDFASHNHFNLGAVSAWFLRDLAGIRPGQSPDIIAPVFPAKINHVDAEWISPQGPIRVHWHREADGIQLHIDTPVPSTLHLPDGSSLPLQAGPQIRNLTL
jgi:alpha-L-rhamnosidase